ncbi:MAG: hypothetical protein ACOY5B_11510 [Spirochaetota bacterium]
MFFSGKRQPLDAVFNDAQFEAIFLHNRYPGSKQQQGGFAEKAELWALYDGEPDYHGLNLLRSLRFLRGIHTGLRIGPRSAANSALRGYCTDSNNEGKKSELWFEAYNGNISDATRMTISMAPYGHAEKSRALSQKSFVRFIVPLAKKKPLEKIDALMLAYAIAALLDKKRFAGIIDADLFLFVPPAAARAGVSNYHRGDRLLNTHLVAGFNHFEQNGVLRFFSHGFNRFGMPDVLVSPGKTVALSTEHYQDVLREMHARFLAYLTKGARAALEQTRPLRSNRSLPEQVTAMMGRKIVELTAGGR